MESIWFSLTFGNISNVDFDLTFVDFDCLPFYTPLLFLRRLPSNKNQNSQKVMSCFKTNLLNSVFHSIFQEVSRKQTLSSFLSIFPVKLKHQIMHYYHIIVYYWLHKWNNKKFERTFFQIYWQKWIKFYLLFCWTENFKISS